MTNSLLLALWIPSPEKPLLPNCRKYFDCKSWYGQAKLINVRAKIKPWSRTKWPNNNILQLCYSWHLIYTAVVPTDFNGSLWFTLLKMTVRSILAQKGIFSRDFSVSMLCCTGLSTIFSFVTFWSRHILCKRFGKRSVTLILSNWRHHLPEPIFSVTLFKRIALGNTA